MRGSDDVGGLLRPNGMVLKERGIVTVVGVGAEDLVDLLGEIEAELVDCVADSCEIVEPELVGSETCSEVDTDGSSSTSSAPARGS